MFTNSTTSFPDLHSKLSSTSLNDNATRKIGIDSSITPSIDQHTPPKYPNYLKLTTYSDLVQEQYELMNGQQSFSPQPLGNDLTWVQPGADFDKHFTSLDLRLPSMWNDKDRAKHINVDTQGLVLKYIGPGKTEAHAGSIRANFPIRPQAGLFYYEVEILSKGEDGYIGIGFCTKKNDLERLPGWDVDSFGYHGDDGHGFAGSGTGDTFGPKFTTGDIIGCGVNFADASAFYTKNGRLIGTAFSSLDLSKQYYPVIGLRTPGECVKTNFGIKEFMFDVELYIKDHATLLWKDVMQKKGSCEPFPLSTRSCLSGNSMATLVMEYLLHHGFESSARTLVEDYQHTTAKDSLERFEFDESAKEAKQRQDIKYAIIEGHIGEAIRLIDRHYPSAFNHEEKRTDILFELRCAKIVEIMRKCTSLRRQTRWCERSSDRISKEKPSLDYDYLDHQLPTRYTSHEFASPQNINQHNRHTSWKSTATYERSSHTFQLSFGPKISDHSMTTAPDKETDMTIPSPISASPTSTYSSSSYTLPLESSSLDSPITSVDISEPTTMDNDYDGDDNDDCDEALLLKAAMALGQRLQEDYRMNKRPDIKNQMTSIASLIADPNNSPLLDPSYRLSLASKLNSAILESQSRPAVSSLEMVYQQTVVVNKYLSREGNGKSALLKADALDRMVGVD